MVNNKVYTIEDGFSGWVLPCNSPFSGKDMLKLGFRMVNHRMYPDDIETAAKIAAKAGYKVTDLSHERKKTTSNSGKLCKLFKIH